MFRLVPEVSYALILSDFCFIKKNLKLTILPLCGVLSLVLQLKSAFLPVHHYEGEHFSCTSPGLSWTAHLSKMNMAKLQAINLKYIYCSKYLRTALGVLEKEKRKATKKSLLYKQLIV